MINAYISHVRLVAAVFGVGINENSCCSFRRRRSSINRRFFRRSDARTDAVPDAVPASMKRTRVYKKN